MNFIPSSLTPAQARLALNYFGLRDQVETAIAAAGQDVKDRWEYATAIDIDHPFVLDMCDAIGISRGQLHELFMYGMTQ